MQAASAERGAAASIVIPGLTRDPPFFATVAEGKWTPDQVRGDEYENANVCFRPKADGIAYARGGVLVWG